MGIYGEGQGLIKELYEQGLKLGGRIITGTPDSIEHGLVYAG